MTSELNMLVSPHCEKPVSYTDSLLMNLKRRQMQAKSELDSVTAAIEALNKNPEVANILELISKAGR